MTTTLPSAIADKAVLDTAFTSTGAKLFHHQEAMQALRDGSGKPISAWCAPTDVCNAKCGFCSVGMRPQNSLTFAQIQTFLDQLIHLGLRSITWSGGGNPCLYRCKETGKTLNDVIEYAHSNGLENALITNGLPLQDYDGRKSWKGIRPETLDKLTWCRISMAGIDHNHKEQCVYVPDFDRSKTTLGFSWIMADSYEEPSHKHGWVSTPDDIVTEMPDRKVILATDRLEFIEGQIRHYVETYKPVYTRLLCDCLRPDLIPERHKILQDIAYRINPEVVFSQNKPPYQPKTCFKVLTRPCLNSDNWVYPCDSVVLNKTAGHKFDSAWRICKGEEVGELFAKPAKFTMPENICPGCVFADQVNMIYDVVHGMETSLPSGPPPTHANFV